MHWILYFHDITATIWSVMEVTRIRILCSHTQQITVLCNGLETCIQFFSMTWQIFRMLQHPWQSNSFEILIGGFQKGKTQPCTSKYIKVTRYQTWKKKLQSLTSCNFDASWGTSPCLPFLETSNQYLKGDRLSWVLQSIEHLPGHAEKLYTCLKTIAQNCNKLTKMDSC